jgi:histidinol-phosphate/aromatic aminotransferase/cobyric acid decarboxylase-like protein
MVNVLGHHGDTSAAQLRALGVDPARVLDLSVNVSPFGPSPRVLAAIREADVVAYPDRGATAAREVLGASLGVEPAALMLGNGAAELIWAAVRGLSRPGDTLVIAGPTFSEAEAAARAHGLSVVEVRACAKDAFAPPAAALARTLAQLRPALLYLCHPNNPTGQALPAGELHALIAGHPGTTFLVDHAFLSLSERHLDAGVPLPPNALALRSLTKDHALAGLRLAYALGAPATLARVAAQQPPWSVSSLALAAACAAASEEAYIADVRARWLVQRRELEQLLTQQGIPHVPSLTVFGLVHVGDAERTRTRLLHEASILVRSAASFGLPEHIRVRASDQNARLVDALRAPSPN